MQVNTEWGEVSPPVEALRAALKTLRQSRHHLQLAVTAARGAEAAADELAGFEAKLFAVTAQVRKCERLEMVAMMSNQAVTGVLEVGVHNTSQKLALVDFLTELLNTPDKDLKSVLKMRRFKAKLEYAVPAAEAFSIPEESLQTVRDRRGRALRDPVRVLVGRAPPVRRLASSLLSSAWTLDGAGGRSHHQSAMGTAVWVGASVCLVCQPTVASGSALE